MINASQELKFHKFETDSTDLSSHNEAQLNSICIASIIYLPKQHGDWRATDDHIFVISFVVLLFV